MEGEGDIKVSDTQKDKEYNPAQIHTNPDLFRQADGVFHHSLNQRFLANELTAQEGSSKDPVDNGCFPFQEALILEGQRHATK